MPVAKTGALQRGVNENPGSLLHLPMHRLVMCLLLLVGKKHLIEAALLAMCTSFAALLAVPFGIDSALEVDSALEIDSVAPIEHGFGE